MIDATEQALVTLINQGETIAGWSLVLAVTNDNVIILRNLMVANCSGATAQFAMMICPNSYTPVSGIDQPNVIFKIGTFGQDESYNQSLNAAVPSGYSVYVWASSVELNYHLSGIVGQR